MDVQDLATAQLAAERDPEIAQVAADRAVDQLAAGTVGVRRLQPGRQQVHRGLALLDRRHCRSSLSVSAYPGGGTVPHRSDAVAWSP